MIFFLQTHLQFLVVQMKFGEICEKLQPSGDINAFMVKKQLMSSIFGKFYKSIIFSELYLIHQHQFIKSKRSDRRYKSCSKTNLGLDCFRKFLLKIYTLKLSEINVSRSFWVRFRVFSRYLGKIQIPYPEKMQTNFPGIS